MPEPDDRKMVRQATRIFLRLREDPGNPALVRQRAQFLARGPEERSAYNEVARAWRLSGRGKRRSSLYGAVVLALLAAALVAAFEPGRIALTADFQTEYDDVEVRLASGDRAHLDAGTAVIDKTDASFRTITLLSGAAYFEVQVRERAFEVEIGSLIVRALGTAFEVEQLDETVFVSVAEGQVALLRNKEEMVLQAGQRLRWSPVEGVTIDDIDVATIAAWRDDRIVADGLSFVEAVRVIDRRLPGRILVWNEQLSDARVSGGLSLVRPLLALEALAAAEGARVLTAPLLGSLVLP